MVFISISNIATTKSSHASNDAEKFSAATILNLTKYMDIGKNSDIEVCIINDEKIQLIVETFIAKRNFEKISDVKGFEKPNNEIKTCDIVYISDKNISTANKSLDMIEGIKKPVVTVSNIDDFTKDNKGIVAIFEEKGRYRYSLNLKKAKSNNIKINSKLIESAYKLY